MSPLTLRRYRAERLLREEYDALRGRVIATVRGRLRASGVSLDAADLEACYAHAWQGLYMAMLEGQEIANPPGWLMLVTFRRAIEEQRARRRTRCDAGGTGFEESLALRAPPPAEGTTEPDLAAELDDRLRLRELFEGLRLRLNAREREAAVLCYLQGLSRAEAAACMGVSEMRMRKLMEGRAGRPGVAEKVGALAQTIRGGGWCEEQSSLMRGLAFGILDPAGERYRLALIHRNECPACRAYVVSLRGLAAGLPPVFLPAGLGAGALALVGAGGAGSPATGALAGAVGASGAGAGGAAGGGWLLAGGSLGLGAKLAAGCLLAIGVGAGCVALGGAPDGPASPARRATPPAARSGQVGVTSGSQPSAGLARAASSPSTGAGSAPRTSVASVPPRADGASREFGLERAGVPGAKGRHQARPAGSAAAPPAAAPEPRVGSATVAASDALVRAASSRAAQGPAGGAGEARAQREFSPG